MEWYQILSLVVSAVVSVLSLFGIGTVAKFFWEDKHRKKLEETEEVKRLKKEERRQEIAEIIAETMGPCSDKIVKSIEKIEKRLDLAKQCDLAELRNSLMNIYYTCSAKGYKTEDDSKNYREMHEAYNALGGNSFIDSDVSRWFDALTMKPNDYQGKVQANTKAASTPRKRAANKGKGKEKEDNHE